MLSGIALAALVLNFAESSFIFEDRLGLTPSMTGLILSAITTGEIAGAFLNVFLVQHARVKHIVFSGALIMLFSGVLMWFLNAELTMSIYTILIPAWGVALGTGLILSNASSEAFSLFKYNIGTTGSSFGAIQVLSLTLITFIFTQHAHEGIPALASGLIINSLLVSVIPRSEFQVKIQSASPARIISVINGFKTEQFHAFQ